MHFVVMGCGRVGSSLATQLDNRGHSVSVIDVNPESFRRLPASFSGQQVMGIGFDRDVLEQAGIEDAYAFAAVADGDNSNILAARIVRETFGVRNVVARIYDPARAEVYERLGIPTVGTVKRTTQAVLVHMLPLEPEVIFMEETGELVMLRALPDSSWAGVSISSLEENTGARLVFINRLASPLLPEASSAIQDGDEVVLMCRADQREEVARTLAHNPKELG
ncbi:MAG: TrkA family potassium uptake protein [Actinomycetaceae bacterium]|nr:TrkA family potassium uptake protein [Actinomycetaceae bacterium]